MLNMAQPTPRICEFFGANFLRSFFVFLAKNFKTRPEVFQTNIVSIFFSDPQKETKQETCLPSFVLSWLSVFVLLPNLWGVKTRKKKNKELPSPKSPGG